MISGRDIVFISSIEWGYLWQIHQEIALRFAESGNRVLFVENTGIRAPTISDTARVAARLRRWGRTLFSGGVRKVAPNVFVTSPIVMPPFGPGPCRFINRRLFLPAVKRIAAKMNFRDPLLWTFLPSDTALDLIRLLASPESVIMYYCGADFSLLATKAQPCLKTEDELLHSTDLVFATCSRLVERCRAGNSNVHTVPALIDLEAFPGGSVDGDSCVTHRKRVEGPEPRIGAFPIDLPKPIIGYVGGLHRFVDYRLLTEMALSRPAWSWVFVGAATTDVGELAGLPNVHLLGQRPHSQLARYIREFDVCIVPYVNSELTATVVPMKLNEYLAMGKPVVSAALPTVCDFNQLHQILITAPNQSAAFLRAIDQALSLASDEETVRRRREVAELGDSRAFLKTVSKLIESVVRERSSQGSQSNIAGLHD